MSSTGCDLQTQLTEMLHPMIEHRQSVRDLLGHDLFVRQDGLSRSDRNALTYERMRFIGKWAAPGTSLVADQWRYVSLMEHVAVVDPALFLALGVHLGVCLGTLRNFGGSAEVSATVAALDDMNAVAVILTTELGHGTSQGASRTVARFDPHRREFTLQTPDAGAQKFMANVAAPGVPKIGIVFATVMRDDRAHGIFPFVVSLRDAEGTRSGVHVVGLGDAGATSLDHSLVSFENVRVPYGSWLRGEAEFDSGGEFHDPLGEGQRVVQSVAGIENMWVGLTAAAAAVARASTAVFARYAQQRITAGGLTSWLPVIRYRNQQEAVFGAMAASYALTFLVNKALRDHQALRAAEAAGVHQSEGMVWGPWSALNHDLALVKVFATKTAGLIGARCRERCGAQGVLSANRFLDYEGFAHAGMSMGGDNQLIMFDAARNMMLAREVGTPSGESDRHPADADLRDPPSLLSLARFREQRLLGELDEQVRSTREGGAAEFDAWNDSLVSACTAMEARGQRALLEGFSEAVDIVDEQALRRLLLPLQTLHAVEEIEEHAGWYLSEGLLSSDTLRAIPTVKHECYDALMSSLDVLVHALDVPEDLVQAPIMAEDYIKAFPAPAFLPATPRGR